jgi:hypothetical protein
MIPPAIIMRWAMESDVFSARPDAPVVDDRPERRGFAVRLLSSLRSNRHRFRSELAKSPGGQHREAAGYVSCPGTQSLDPAGGGCDEAGGGASSSSSRATIPVGMRSRSLASGSPAATSRSACT